MDIEKENIFQVELNHPNIRYKDIMAYGGPPAPQPPPVFQTQPTILPASPT